MPSLKKSGETMNTKHTPGPWHLINVPSHGPEIAWRLPKAGMVDAPVCHMRWSDGLKEETTKRIMADAQLIAAAPELLDALQGAKREFEALDRTTQVIYTNIVAAIANATRATQ